MICTLQVAVAIAICERTRYTRRACDAHAREHELTRFFCIEEKDLMLDVKSITRLICVLQVAVARHDGRDLSGDTGGWRLARGDGDACLPRGCLCSIECLEAWCCWCCCSSRIQFFHNEPARRRSHGTRWAASSHARAACALSPRSPRGHESTERRREAQRALCLFLQARSTRLAGFQTPNQPNASSHPQTQTGSIRSTN